MVCNHFHFFYQRLVQSLHGGIQGDGKLEQFTPNLCTLKVRVRSPELTPYECRRVGYTFKTSVSTKNFVRYLSMQSQGLSALHPRPRFASRPCPFRSDIDVRLPVGTWTYCAWSPRVSTGESYDDTSISIFSNLDMLPARQAYT